MAGSIEMLPIPERGVWTAVGLTRGQFFSILFAALVVFLLWGGPLWNNIKDAHTGRIVARYGAIPLLVAVALWRNHAFRIRSWFEALVPLALIKLLVTVVGFVAMAFI